MAETILDVKAPWRIDTGTDIAVTINDSKLIGSEHHVLRFDLYPNQVPGHPERHHGYWDVPMQRIRSKRTVFRLGKNNLLIRGLLFHQRFFPTWRSTLPMAGPAVMTLSLIDLSQQPARTIQERSSMHLLLHDSDTFPLVRVNLLVTSRCNLKCRFCKRELINHKGRKDTPPAVIDAVVDASRHLASVLIHADGEPLLNRSIPEVLTRFKNTMPHFGKVGLLTNGMLLDRDTARDLVDRGLDWLSVSIDGSNKSTMEAIRRGSRFEVVVKNAAYAVEYARKQTQSNIDFSIVFTTHESNFREIPSMVDLAGQLGIQNLVIGHLIRFESCKFETQPKELLVPLLEEAKLRGLEQGVKVQAQTTEPLVNPQCPYLDEATVHVSGDVCLCNLRNPDKTEEPLFVVGNVKEKLLHDIWESPTVKELRRRIAAADFPKQCEPCCYVRWGTTVKL